MNVISETLVDEMRAARLDLLARAKFAEDGESIYETRTMLDDLLGIAEPESDEMKILQSAEKFRSGALEHDLIEIG